MDYSLFTYGTLRVDEPNSEILKHNSKFQETCITVEKYIMVTQNSKSFPFVFPISFWPEMEHKAVNVVGDLYSVNKTSIGRCDKLEGHPICYKRTPIIIKNITGQIIQTEMYLLTKEYFEELDKTRIIILGGDWKRMD
jgi:gamma-glutamylaminecyclotransferase